MKSVGGILLLIFSLAAVFGQRDLEVVKNFQTTSSDIKIEESANNQRDAVVKVRGKRSTEENSAEGRLRSYMSKTTEGTGFIVSDEGAILTNRHVVDGDSLSYQVVLSNGLSYEVKEIKFHPTTDIAIIKINPKEHEFKLSKLDLGDSGRIKIGIQVAALGNDPGKIKPTLLIGEIKNIGETIIAGDYRTKRAERLRNIIETNIDLKPGNSGSPLLDKDGKVIGINTAASIGEEVESYAVPINQAKQLLDQ